MVVLTGPDVSRHQGPVNWQEVKDAGHTFAFCKATDGTSYRYTNYFHTQFARMQDVGLVPGAYHWLQPGSGAAQARYFVETVGDFTGVLAVVDVEKNPSGTYPSIGTVYEFAAEFARLTGGHTLIVYTGAWFWVGYLRDPQGSQIGPLWHSEYDGSTPDSPAVANGPEMDNYGGWASATFWQHTSSGLCPGISTRCDLNIFYGDLAYLNALANGTSAVPKPVPPTHVTPSKDDDMPWIHSSPWTGQALIAGDTVTWIESGDTVRSLQAQGVPVFVFDKSENDARRVIEERTNVRDDLLRIEMRLAAIQNKVVDGV